MALTLSVEDLAAIRSEVTGALEDIYLDMLFAATYDRSSPPGVPSALINTITEDAGSGTPRLTRSALQRTWDVDTSGHTTVGTFGEQVKTDVDAILVEANKIASIKTKTDGLNFTGSNVDAVLANTDHGGSSTTVTFKKLVGATSTAGESVVSLTASGSGNSHGIVINSTNAKAIALGSTNSDAMSIDSGAARGLVITGATGDIVADITGNLSGSVGSVTGSIGSLGTTAKSDVNAEVLDVLNTDTFAEPGQEAPPATTTLIKKIGYLYKLLRNKIETTANTISVYNDAKDTVDHKSTISDNGTTFTRDEFVSGP